MGKGKWACALSEFLQKIEKKKKRKSSYKRHFPPPGENSSFCFYYSPHFLLLFLFLISLFCSLSFLRWFSSSQREAPGSWGRRTAARGMARGSPAGELLRAGGIGGRGEGRRQPTGCCCCCCSLWAQGLLLPPACCADSAEDRVGIWRTRVWRSWLPAPAVLRAAEEEGGGTNGGGGDEMANVSSGEDGGYNPPLSCAARGLGRGDAGAACCWPCLLSPSGKTLSSAQAAPGTWQR